MSKRNLFEYRRPVTLGPTGLLIDDIITGFEGAAITGWTSVVGQYTTITLIKTDGYFGAHCVQIDVPTFVAGAQMYRATTNTNTGKYHMLAYVKVITYYGTTENDWQTLSAADFNSTVTSFAFRISATDVKVIHHNTIVQVLTTPLEVGVWHKLDAECDFDAKRTRFWIDDVLVGDYTDTTLVIPSWLHIGTVSSSVGRGKFYWDTILYGTIIE